MAMEGESERVCTAQRDKCAPLNFAFTRFSIGRGENDATPHAAEFREVWT